MSLTIVIHSEPLRDLDKKKKKRVKLMGPKKYKRNQTKHIEREKNSKRY